MDTYHVIWGYTDAFKPKADIKYQEFKGQYDKRADAVLMADKALECGYDWGVVIGVWSEAGSPCATVTYRAVRRGEPTP